VTRAEQLFYVAMTPNDFRKLALALPEAAESAHMNHPDFRVRGKIFATLWPDGEHGMVKLAPDDQVKFTDAEPDAFHALKGAWGKRGCTSVHLATATRARMKSALAAAWRNTAPKSLSKLHEDL
jgi:hypothetical protein